jgi:hypothetical protein
MQNHAGPKNMCKKTRETCFDEGYLAFRPSDGQNFAPVCQGKKKVAQLTNEDHSFGSSMPFTSTDSRARLPMVSSPP